MKAMRTEQDFQAYAFCGHRNIHRLQEEVRRQDTPTYWTWQLHLQTIMEMDKKKTYLSYQKILCQLQTYRLQYTQVVRKRFINSYSLLEISTGHQLDR